MVSDLQTEHFRLNGEIFDLKTENANLKAKVLALQSAKPQQEENKAKVVPDLNDVCKAILKKLANFEDHDDAAPDIVQLATAIGHPYATTMRYADMLIDLWFVNKIESQDGYEEFYVVTKTGLAYAVDNGLVK